LAYPEKQGPFRFISSRKQNTATSANYAIIQRNFSSKSTSSIEVLFYLFSICPTTKKMSSAVSSHRNVLDLLSNVDILETLKIILYIERDN